MPPRPGGREPVLELRRPRRRRSRRSRRRPTSSWSRRHSGPPAGAPPAAGRGRAGVPVEVPRYRWSGPVLGEAGQHVPDRRARSKAAARSVSTPDRIDRSVDARGASNRARGLGGAPASSGVEQGEGVLGRRRPGRVLLGRPDQLGHVDVTAPAGDPGGQPTLDLPQADDGHPPVAPDAVGGGGVVGEADLGFAGLLDDDHAVVASRPPRRPGPLDHVLGRAAARPARGRAHRPDSSRALRTRTPRTSTEGQPWLTGATWPGWPLPQLKAPPSR